MLYVLVIANVMMSGWDFSSSIKMTRSEPMPYAACLEMAKTFNIGRGTDKSYAYCEEKTMTNKQALDAFERITDDLYIDGNNTRKEDIMTVEAALTQHNQALVEALKTIANMPEGGSNDLEIKIAKEALTAASSAPVVEVENNIKLLCHECGKTHEHEYNQPPRHGSCEVCGRQNMLCTRVMTEAARLQLERQKMGGI